MIDVARGLYTATKNLQGIAIVNQSSLESLDDFLSGTNSLPMASLISKKDFTEIDMIDTHHLDIFPEKSIEGIRAYGDFFREVYGVFSNQVPAISADFPKMNFKKKFWNCSRIESISPGWMAYFHYSSEERNRKFEITVFPGQLDDLWLKAGFGITMRALRSEIPIGALPESYRDRES